MAKIKSPLAAHIATNHHGMEVNPFTLAFSGSCAILEKPFLQDYARNSLSLVRLTLILGVLFYGAFGALDAIIAPATQNAFWFIRFGVVCPSIVLVYLLSFSPFFLRHMQPAIVFLALVAGLGIIYMTVLGNELTRQTYYVGLILILMMAYTLSRVRFMWATPACLTLMGIYFFAALWNSTLPPALLANNLFFCGTANVIGMLVCYSMEYYARRDFFISKLLDDEHKRVEAAKIILEQKVKQRTALLAQANEELRREIEAHQRLDWEKKSLEEQLLQAQKMEAIGTLAGGIAHDFNNMLAAIMGHTELAMMQRGAPQKTEACLVEVLKASERAKDLVSQILSFSRHSDSKLKPIQISSVVKEVMRLLRASLPSTIIIETSIEAENSIVIADATQIHQILMNLGTNAAHAMEGQSGLLRVELKDRDMPDGALSPMDHFSTRPAPGRYVCLSVADTGHGIAAHLRDRIFDPYFTTKDKGVGTGLGLAVVRGIVQNHGGTIEVQSEPGKGTTFFVWLPRAEGAPDREFNKIQMINPGSESILLVDDDPVLAELGAKLLSILGYRVVYHSDAQQALYEFRQNPDIFDLVITDIIMPHINGKALALEILNRRPGIPIIMYTGFSDAIKPEELKNIGVRQVLRKPITIHGLSQAIRQELETRRLR